MRKILGIVAFIFAIFIFVVLIENYGIEHNNKVIVVDTCISDSVQVVIDTLSIDSIVK